MVASEDTELKTSNFQSLTRKLRYSSFFSVLCPGIKMYSCMSLYMRWPSTNFYTFSFFFREIVMRKNLARGEITISPRVTSAHDDFTEKSRFCTYINSNRNRFSERPLMSGIEISSSQGLKKPPKMSPREEKDYPVSYTHLRAHET